MPEIYNQESRSEELSTEEMLMEIHTPKPFPGGAEKFFGKENLTQFQNLIHGDFMQDINRMILDGDISTAETMEYIACLSESIKTTRDLDQIAFSIVNSMPQEKIRFYVDSLSKGSDKLFSVIIFIQDTFISQLTDEDYWAMNSLIMSIIPMIQVSFLQKCHTYSQTSCQNKEARLMRFIRSLSLSYGSKNNTGVDTRADPVSRAFYIEAEASSILHRLSDDLTTMLGENTESDTAGLKEENGVFLKELDYLSVFRTNHDAFFDLGNGQAIQILAEPPHNTAEERLVFKMNFIAHIVVILQAHGKHEISACENIDGEIFRKERSAKRTASFELDILKGGDMNLSGTKVPVTKIISPLQYEQLKNIIFHKLYDYYSDKDPDIEELLIANSSTDAGVAGVISEDDEKDAFDWRAYLQDTVGDDAELDDNQDVKDIIVENYAEYWRTLNNVSSNKLFRAIKKILGEPIRVRGSHHIFEGKSGARYPIPFHGNDKVGVGLLKQCLQKWEISPRELCEKL